MLLPISLPNSLKEDSNVLNLSHAQSDVPDDSLRSVQLKLITLINYS